MILPQYQYKDNLALSARLAIAHTYVRLGGYHGLVTELARDYNTNRQQIYAILNDVEDGFAPQLPGPKPEVPFRLHERIAALEEANKRLEQENAN